MIIELRKESTNININTLLTNYGSETCVNYNPHFWNRSLGLSWWYNYLPLRPIRYFLHFQQPPQLTVAFLLEE